YLYDRASNSNSLVSHIPGDLNVGADGASNAAAISADGRFVAFQSSATDLVNGLSDANSSTDIFRYDRVTGQTQLVSRDASALATADNASRGPVISNDGQFVGFQSTATNLIGGFTDGNALESGAPDIYLFDATTGSNTLVSRVPASSATSGDGGS